MARRPRPGEGGDAGDAARCARELADPALLAPLVEALTADGYGWDQLRDAYLVYGKRAIAELERRRAGASGKLNERLGWMLDELRDPRRQHMSVTWGDEYFVKGRLDDFTASAFTAYSAVLRHTPSAHAAFQCAWIDRAWAAPVPAARVDWIRSLGFRDEAFLAELAQPLERPFAGIRSDLRGLETSQIQQALDAGLPSIAFLATREPRHRAMAEDHVERVRSATA